MSELYLIAHKVRGEPAFDVAQRMDCPECHGRSAQEFIDGPCICNECDSEGYWWIIPTSGHRAYPFINWPFNELYYGDADGPSVLTEAGPLIEHPAFESAQDHYTTSAAPTRTLADMLGFLHAPLARRAPPLKRRF